LSPIVVISSKPEISLGGGRVVVFSVVIIVVVIDDVGAVVIDVAVLD